MRILDLDADAGQRGANGNLLRSQYFVGTDLVNMGLRLLRSGFQKIGDNAEAFHFIEDFTL